MKLKYLYLDQGEYLYNIKTNDIYTYSKPHKIIGKIDIETLRIIKKLDSLEADYKNIRDLK